MKNPNTRCTIQLNSGDFCDSPSHPDAPFPICPKHARKAYLFGADLARQASTPDGDLLSNRLDGYFTTRPRVAKMPKDPGVYFLLIDGLIKIGRSNNITKRIRQGYPPNAKVLHLHRTPCHEEIEGRLHQKFARHLAHGREWFNPHPEILAYIAHLEARANA